MSRTGSRCRPSPAALTAPSGTPRQSRVAANVERILALFSEANVRATFFTLGWIAQRHPAMVRRIVAAGHELASHGWGHVRADAQDPATFRADVERTRLTLEDIGGVAVTGYRAATFSIGARNLWTFRVLEQVGYTYSSSVNPIRHDLYGMPDAPRMPFRPEGGRLWEIPMTTVAAFGRNWPCAGGGYFRLLPYGLYRRGLSSVHRNDHASGVFYFHPWEVDPNQPRVGHASWKSKLRHYTNLSTMHGKLERVLRDFTWDRMDRVFAELVMKQGVEKNNDELPLPLREGAGGGVQLLPHRGSSHSSPRPPPSREGGVPAPSPSLPTSSPPATPPPPPDHPPCRSPFARSTMPARPRGTLSSNAMPEGTFFHRAAWARVIQHAFGHRTFFSYAEQDGAITGILPLAQVKTPLFGNTLISSPFCVYGGPLAADSDSAAALEAHAETLLRNTRAGAVELRDRQPMAARRRAGSAAPTSMSHSASQSRPITTAT